jgi:endonuclease/exonuclease/phosphatase (EEP) superfamily protein YafD
MNLMSKNTVKNILGILILGMTIAFILPTEYSFLGAMANYTVHLMFATLAMGLLFLALDEKRLLFTCFIACGILCLYLKNSSNNVLKLPTKTVAEVLNIGQLNIASTHEHIFETIESIKQSNLDVVSLQEINPDVAQLLKSELHETYPHKVIVHRMEDFLGVGIFSKLPFLKIDTFYNGDRPNLCVDIKCAQQDIAIVSSYVYPELSIADRPDVRDHFKKIESYVQSKSCPVITVGDYNQLQFSNYLKDFKRSSLLNDSRRFHFFDNPTDHIFFSSQFDCVEFQTISNRYTNHLGIKGSYQLNNATANAKE